MLTQINIPLLTAECNYIIADNGNNIYIASGSNNYKLIWYNKGRDTVETNYFGMDLSPTYSNIYNMIVDSTNNLYVIGTFKNVIYNGISTSCNGIAKWTPYVNSSLRGYWSNLDQGINNNNNIASSAIDSNDNIYIGGLFTSIGNNESNTKNIAIWGY